MKKFLLLVPALAFSLVMANPGVAADKAAGGKATMKVLLENDRVKVYETTYKPGDVNQEVPSAFHRINRTMKDGTIERTYKDGKKEKLELKAGTVRFLEPAKPNAPTYTVQNVGKTDYVSYVVLLKK